MLKDIAGYVAASVVAAAVAAVLIVLIVMLVSANVTMFEAAVDAGLVQEQRVGDNGALWTLPSRTINVVAHEDVSEWPN